MGCTQSKIENEEAVSRCKDRKQFMKDAVSYRNAFAAAHSSYATYLKNTGAALSDYAHGEVQNPQLSSTNILVNPSVTTQQPFENLPPPPPPLPKFTSPPLQRAASMPEIKIPKPNLKPVGPIIEEEVEDEDEDEFKNEESLNSSLRRRSSRNSGGTSRSGNKEVEDEVARPPKPPSPKAETRQVPPPPPQDSTWDYFFSSMENMPGPTLSEAEEVNVNKEEIERKAFYQRTNRVDDGDEDPKSGKNEVPKPAPMPEKVVEPPVPPPAAAATTANTLKKVKQVGQSSVEGKRIVKSNVNLLQIFTELDDHFLKASESAHEVSKMLEATRLHYHSNFADNRGHIDHSARVMRVITWNRSIRGLADVGDGKDDFDSEEHETHATVLDKLLAWEKKLYDEVKAGELMKFEYQKKVATLNKQKKRGHNSEALEKAKAALSHLHTRYIVDMQSMDSTVSEINRLRDEQLYPKLVQLVDGMATMWETMQIHHGNQLKIVAALKSLDISQSPKETSEHHHERTYQLWVVVQEWHSQFDKLIKNQKGYIKALSNWLKLNLIPIESSLKEKVSSPPRIQNPPIQGLLHAWQNYLEKLPDELARAAISNFGAVIDTIFHHQAEEMQLKRKCEETQKELTRKTRQFQDWYNKYMQRKIPDEVDPDRAEDKSHDDAVAERQFLVETLKKRLEDEEDGYRRQCLQVRDKSLASLKHRLPELFGAMSEFSLACSEMYKALRSISQLQNPKHDLS
ncbi:Protein of unknown function (DUF630 and DUF632) [Quillaja saponaria]|uniref:Nitrate regulatory gene2 protein-like n=1 Tax=Quillaja saponaria TaxID=32244 RepID=A0AAD7PEG2_QUISA|nr:Protein of unknown function (DUF630 and DUF632) [Quillaja saponaria]